MPTLALSSSPHSGHSPHVSASADSNPYRIDLDLDGPSTGRIGPDHEISVSLEKTARDGPDFKGFLIRAVEVGTGNIVGNITDFGK